MYIHKIMMEVVKAATSGRIMRRRTMERNRAVIRREDSVEEREGAKLWVEVVGSCDVKALHLSLKKKECAEAAGEVDKDGNSRGEL